MTKDLEPSLWWAPGMSWCHFPGWREWASEWSFLSPFSHCLPPWWFCLDPAWASTFAACTYHPPKLHSALFPLINAFAKISPPQSDFVWVPTPKQITSSLSVLCVNVFHITNGKLELPDLIHLLTYLTLLMSSNHNVTIIIKTFIFLIHLFSPSS